jgi:hypothetical protein
LRAVVQSAQHEGFLVAVGALAGALRDRLGHTLGQADKPQHGQKMLLCSPPEIHSGAILHWLKLR